MKAAVRNSGRTILASMSVLVMLLLLAPLAGQQGGGIRVDPLGRQLGGEVDGVAIAGDTLYWLARDGEASILRRQEGSGAVTDVARGGAWRGVAVDREGVWLAEWGEPTGRLLRVGNDGQIVPALTGLAQPEGLLAYADALYWIETEPPLVPDLPFVPAAGPHAALRRYRAGAVETLARWPTYAQPGESDPIAVTAEGILVRQATELATRILRIVPETGRVEMLVAIPGLQSVVSAAGTLYWTAPSEEVSPRDRNASVWRLGAQGPEYVTDWLPARVQLVAAGPRVFAVYGEGVWEVPPQLGMPRRWRATGASHVAAGPRPGEITLIDPPGADSPVRLSVR